jgi:hypothetical protein
MKRSCWSFRNIHETVSFYLGVMEGCRWGDSEELWSQTAGKVPMGWRDRNAKAHLEPKYAGARLGPGYGPAICGGKRLSNRVRYCGAGLRCDLEWVALAHRMHWQK